MTAVVAKRSVTELETYSGRYVDFLDPQPDTIHIGDIANHLSNICRFGGAVNRFYSVAEHCVRVSQAVAPGYEMAGLLHDAHEAYTNDIIAPMKAVLAIEAPGVLPEIQQRLDEAILSALELDDLDLKAPHIKEIDDLLMFREAAALKYSHGIGKHWGNAARYQPLVGHGWSALKAERMFLERYDELTICARHS